MAHDKHNFCRKNQIFYHRQNTLDYLNYNFNSNLISFFEHLLMFEMLYKINGYIRRELQLKTKDEVTDFFIKTFNAEYRGDRIMHEYIEDLKFIINLYD